MEGDMAQTFVGVVVLDQHVEALSGDARSVKALGPLDEADACTLYIHRDSH